MRNVRVLFESAFDGTITVLMEKEFFMGMGVTLSEALKDLKQGVGFFVRTAKDICFYYQPYLDKNYKIVIINK